MLQRLTVRPSPSGVFRFLTALVLALLLWGWVTNSGNPERTRVFPDVPILTAELPADLIIVSEVGTATVRVSGPRSEVEGLTQTDLALRLDLRGIGEPGQYTVPLEIDERDGFRETRIAPSEVAIIVEERVIKQFPLTVVPPPEAPDRRVGAIQPSASVVTVNGAKSRMDLVDRVLLDVNIGDRTADTTLTIPPRATDASGIPIPEVRIEPVSVQVGVEIEATGTALPVTVPISGEPAGGYVVETAQVEPAEVRVEGPPEVLSALTSIATEPIDVTGETDGVDRLASLQLPAGVRVLEPASGQVEVTIPVRQSGVQDTVEDVTVEVIGKGPGQEAVVEPKTVDVVILVPSSATNLDAGAVRVFVDVRGLPPGVQQVTPLVSVPLDVRWEVIEPATVTVTITEPGAAGTPVALPSPGG